jgi:uncharacterized repeat protein (TIGR01451 family)
MRVIDYTLRPFLNTAEVTADSAASYTTVGGPVLTDADSTPDDSATSPDDNTDIGQAGTGTDVGFDDEDVATVSIDPVYDLALVKVADAATTTYNGSVTFTVTVQNQGNVESGAFTVVDTLPAGVTFVSATGGGVANAGATAVVWTRASIAAGSQVSMQIVVTVSDLSMRPFVNSAEITTDGAAMYSLPGGPVLTDVDSVPGDIMTSAVDNTSIEQAGVGADAGFDDEDTASFDVPIVYDLDLVKRLPVGQSLRLSSLILYEITVTNQGNVPSGLYTVADALPAGLSFVSGSDGATSVGNVVSWTDLGPLAPGSDKVLSVQVRLDDVTQPSYVNVAAITHDGTAALSTPVENVHDADSQPGTPMGQPSPNEDDWSVASLSMPQLVIDNAPLEAPAPRPLPITGADIIAVMGAAALFFAIGLLLVTGFGRRRRARS